MPGPLTVLDGALIEQSPGDKRVYTFDYDADNLPVGVTIAPSTWTITALNPITATGVTKDNETILAGSRKTQVRLLTDATYGAEYRIDNHITTNESPTQEKTKHFVLKVEK